MSDKLFDPVKRRNVILGTGICLLVIGILDDPTVLMLFSSRRGLTKIALFVIAGFCFARGITEIAESVLRSPGEPWYARCGGLGLLIIAMTIITGVCIFVCTPVLHAMGITFHDETAHLYLAVGLTFLWVVLLHWVSYEKQ